MQVQCSYQASYIEITIQWDPKSVISSFQMVLKA